MRISDWSSDVCSSDLQPAEQHREGQDPFRGIRQRREGTGGAGDIAQRRAGVGDGGGGNRETRHTVDPRGTQQPPRPGRKDPQGGRSGQRVSTRVESGGRTNIKKKTQRRDTTTVK